MRRITFVFVSALLGTTAPASFGQLTPQTGVATTPPTAPNPKATLSAITGMGSASIKIQQLMINTSMESKIESTLLKDLKKKGITPGSDTYLYLVRIFGHSGGYRELHSYRYLAKGKSFEDALRESFAQPGGQGSSDILQDAPPKDDQEWGLYFLAVPKDGTFEIKSEHLDKEYYQKIRAEGMDLRDKREQAVKKAADEAAEQERVQKLRDAAMARHQASEPKAQQTFRAMQAVPNNNPTAGRGSDGGTVIITPHSPTPAPNLYIEQRFPRDPE